MENTENSYWVVHEEKVRRTVLKKLPLYERACRRHSRMELPDDLAARVQAALPEYVRLLPYHAGGRTSLFNGLMPLLAGLAAIHMVLREHGWTVDQIGRITYETFFEKYSRTPAFARRIVRNVMVSPLFQRFMRRPTAAMRRSQRTDTFDIEYSFDRSPVATTTVNCSKCGMISFMKRAEMTEMYSYCNIFDFAQGDAFGVGMVQPECIGRGDARCIYHFTRDSSQTRYPQSVRRILGTAMDVSPQGRVGGSDPENGDSY